jgi:hypothetical protein
VVYYGKKALAPKDFRNKLFLKIIYFPIRSTQKAFARSRPMTGCCFFSALVSVRQICDTDINDS